MKQKTRKATSWLLSLALILSLLPGMSLTAYADTAVPYQEAIVGADNSVSYQDQSVSEYTNVTSETTVWGNESGAWYVVNGEITISARVSVTGTANLILCDGAKLTAGSGITVTSDNTLNIYAQSAGTGELVADGAEANRAGIGGGARGQSSGAVNIHGGKVTATGGSISSGIGGALEGSNGTVNIYGGEVTATGDNQSAGIGGYARNNGGTVSIYGGTVKAVGRSYAAGIGCGGTSNFTCNINIFGGDVTATGNGSAGLQGTVNISGGTVVANNNGDTDQLDVYSGKTTYGSSGISGTVNISGGTVTASGGNATTEYNQFSNYGGDIYACGGISGTVTIDGGTVDATGGTVTLTGDANMSSLYGGNTYLSNGICGTTTVNGGTVTAAGGTAPSNLESYGGKLYAMYGFGGGLTVGSGLNVYGGASANPTTVIEKANDDYARHKYMVVLKPHTHDFTYSADGTTITATCNAADCPLTGSKATLTINAPTLKTYGQTGEGVSANATLTGLAAFNAATGKTIATTEIKYVGRDGTTYAESTTAPTDAGKYTAKITVEEKTASVDYEIAKANPTANAPSASATYGQTLADVTLTNPTGNTAGTWAWVDAGTTSVGNVGDQTFKANFTPTDTANYNSVSNVDVTVTVGKAVNPATVTSTTSVTKGGKTVDLAGNVSLNGATGAVSYAISGEASGCTLSGSVLTSGDNSGSVTVNVTVAADDNYNALAATTITVTINDKAAQTITVADVTATYGDTDKSVSATTTGGAISYAVKEGSGDYIDVASDGKLTIKRVPADGKAYVTVTAAETNDYAAATKDVTVTINKKTVTVKAKDQSIYVGGTVPALGSDSYTVTGLVGTDALTTNPTLTYSSTPDNTKAGSYTITPSGAAAGDNYEISYQTGTLTVSSRPSSGGGTPTTTVTVPVSGDDASVNVTVRVSGDTATITGADVDKVLEAEEVGTVTIDVSALKQDVNEVVLPGAMVTKIADAVADENNTADGLEIKLPTGTVSFDADAVAAIAEQANGKDLRLNLEDIGENKLNTAQQSTVKEMDVQEVLDAYMTSSGKRISDFKGGKATVSVPYELKADQIAQGLVVWYVADDGSKTQVPAAYDGKNIVFTVSHFSNYVVAYDAEKAAACPQDETCPMSKFTDLDMTKWYHDGVHWALENGVMNGTGDNRFDPSGTTSRGMIVTILYRLENEPEVTAENPFTDVEDGKWYTKAVIWASENGIVEGYEDGTFAPDSPITREQLAAILYRYAQSKGQSFTGAWMFLLDYPDASEISTWADEAMHWMVMNEIIKGKDGRLVPGGNASRAEAATMLQRFCENVAE